MKEYETCNYLFLDASVSVTTTTIENDEFEKHNHCCRGRRATAFTFLIIFSLLISSVCIIQLRLISSAVMVPLCSPAMHQQTWRLLLPASLVLCRPFTRCICFARSLFRVPQAHAFVACFSSFIPKASLVGPAKADAKQGVALVSGCGPWWRRVAGFSDFIPTASRIYSAISDASDVHAV